MAKARGWATAALLLAITSLWLPWWQLRYHDATGLEYAREQFRVASSAAGIHAWGSWASALTAATGALLLFVRLAGESWRHEPRAWRRDLWVAASLLLVSVALAPAWSATVVPFWGGRAFATADAAFSIHARPGLGWWVALSAAAMSAVAGWRARGARAGTAQPASDDSSAGMAEPDAPAKPPG